MLIQSQFARRYAVERTSSCYTDTGTFLNAQSDIAFEFKSYCNKVSTYEGAFSACNTTRHGVSGAHFKQIKSWNGHNQALYANATVPALLLGCLETHIAATTHHNSVSSGIIVGSILGGMAAIAAVAGVIIYCQKKRGK